MKNFIIIAVIAVVVVLAGFIVWKNGDQVQGPEIDLTAISSGKVLVVASPTCGCCKNYASYLENEGFEVSLELKPQDELNAFKQENGVPSDLLSCHTTIIDGYVIEGHIPVEAIKKLLTEKPDIKGIALPGMPSSSPGMPGPKLEPFLIKQISKAGEDGGLFLEM